MSNLIEQYSIDVDSFNLHREEGKTADELKMILIVEYEVPFSKVPALYKELGGSTRRAGFTNEFYNWLKEGVRTMEEVEEYVKENGSANTVRNLRHYQGVAELANSIHNQ